MARPKPQAVGRVGVDQAAELSSRADADEVLRWCRRVVARTNELESAAVASSADELRGRTGAYRERLRAGESIGGLLPEAFATVREAARRSIGLRHHDVQLMGGAVLHLGKIAEMRTGEGKTLTATLPAYLAALTGQSVHVMTANDYLASRDFSWMRPVYELIDLSVALLRPDPRPDVESRRSAYAVDVTYGVSNEFCYDFLRDNLVLDKSERAQRSLDVAIVDEADLVMLDEMRMKPELSGQTPQWATTWQKYLAEVASKLRAGVDYEVDRQMQRVSLTDEGTDRIEDWLGAPNLYDERNVALLDLIQNALCAKELYTRDQDYAVIDGAVVLLDRTSGRPLPGTRIGGGVHAAIEAKEGLPIGASGELLATISKHDYLSQYVALSGMTGTALSDAQVYRDIYGLDVVPIPTNKPMIRIDHRDVLFRSRAEKLAALATEAARHRAVGQPVLIGTLSSQESDAISGLLSGLDVRHELLSAGNYHREAEILAEAGRPAAVTIVVRMAGRGVDIVLGGAGGAEYEEVADAGGLCVLGAERSTIGRMDMHLRGRAGRQGDPGESRFYVSFDDDLMKGQSRFGTSTLKDGLDSRGVSYGINRRQALTNASHTEWLTRLVAYDEVLSAQQRVVYADRRAVLEQPSLRAKFLEMLDDLVGSGAAHAEAISSYERRERELGAPVMREVERRVLLTAIDITWREHLAAMSDLLTGQIIRAGGQLVPLPEYRREAAQLFEQMTARIRHNAVSTLLTVKVDVQ